MIFRYLQPDCQLLERGSTSPCDLEFLGVHVPLKNCDLKLTEFRRLEGLHADTVLNEHFLTLYVLGKVILTLKDITAGVCDKPSVDATREFLERAFTIPLRRSGLASDIPAPAGCDSVGALFAHMGDVTDQLYREVIGYLRRMSLRSELVAFDGPLCGYLDFLYPFLLQLKTLPFMPRPAKPIYLLVDDADNLNLVQTKILNSWVYRGPVWTSASRSRPSCNTSSYETANGDRIASPHDYSEINISTIYTSHKRLYRDRVREIVKRRLAFSGLVDVTPEGFFPEYVEQEEAIRQIASQLRQDWDKTGRGYRPDDDAIRYARPDYMKSLGGDFEAELQIPVRRLRPTCPRLHHRPLSF